ncbi:MAG: CvpA family protein [Alphaproteobacteria bacterium]|nr:CvpA family protein [Rickettsiales bacterium]
MSLQNIAFNIGVTVCMAVLGFVGNKNGVVLEIYKLATNILAGLFAFAVGSTLYWYAEFSANLDILLPLFVFTIAVPLNSLLQSLIIPNYTENNLNNNNPSFYIFGIIVGTVRGLLMSIFLVATISVTNNAEMFSNVKNNGFYKTLDNIGNNLSMITPYFYQNKQKAEHIKQLEAEHAKQLERKNIKSLNSNCSSLLENAKTMLNMVAEKNKDKETTYSSYFNMITQMDCDLIKILNSKLSYLKSIGGFNDKIVGYVVTKIFITNVNKHDLQISKEEEELIASNAISYMESINIENIIYQIVIKKQFNMTNIKTSVNKVK